MWPFTIYSSRHRLRSRGTTLELIALACAFSFAGDCAVKKQLCCICKTAPGEICLDLPALKCPVCLNCIEPVAGSNMRRIGRQSPLPTFSVEFEIETSVRSERERALVLLLLGYLRTFDISVSDEYKSPIYQSLDVFRSHLPTLDTLKGLVSGACGTHLHVGIPPWLKQRVSKMRGDLFGPLVDHWSIHLDQTEDFWGRKPCSYAKRDLFDLFPCIRVSGRYDTIEFRLPRFRTAHQYVAVVRFCRALTYSLQNALSSESKRERAHAPEHIGRDLVPFYEASVNRYHFWQLQHRLKLHGVEQLLLFP